LPSWRPGAVQFQHWKQNHRRFDDVPEADVRHVRRAREIAFPLVYAVYLGVAESAHESMLADVRLNAPSADTINSVMIGGQLVARHAIASVEYAMELGGGAGFYRSAGLERRFRDIQAARYHPLQAGPQAEYAGSMALGLSVDRIF
jgi:alkylation response protein AidB-like acyl-CoA dehydrogenase